MQDKAANMTTTLLFAGQGSQHYRMGGDLYEQSPVFRQRMQALDELAIDALGVSLVDMLYGGAHPRGEAFDRLLYTSPAIFMVEMAAAAMQAASGDRPQRVVGASLGLFAAACVAGCLSVEDGMRAVIGQARIVEQRCPAGVMLAVLAAPQMIERDAALRGLVEVAGLNAEHVTILSARLDQLDAVAERLQATDLTWQRLPVTRAYHSRWIAAAQEPCMALFKDLRIAKPSMSLVCSAKAGELQQLTPEMLWDTLRQPIRFAQTVRQIAKDGPHLYLDAGPAGTLATLLKYNLPAGPASVVRVMMSPYGGTRPVRADAACQPA